MNKPGFRRWLRRSIIAIGCILGFILTAGLYFVRWTPYVFRPELSYKSEQLLPFYKATEWTLFSLSPKLVFADSPSDPVVSAPNVPELFYDHPILGKVATPITSDIKAIVADLDKSGKHWSGAVYACFSPRHGIRAVENGKVHDLLICYECASAEIYENSVQVGTIYLSSDHYDRNQNERFNAILIRAGIPTALPPQEKSLNSESDQ
ncbi:hypothetical protein [Verrucomicrobium sp. BvORR034]|uniref:hypothetical protein n=1 Tax=Verrucomicrobium sp. BvORR034 TaxID=1396418 RepID=UPI000678C355|nr:hypothetical protein [Verrucomicrobium sp. BvORR034]